MSSWLSRESRGWVRMEAPFRTGVGCVEAGGLVSQLLLLFPVVAQPIDDAAFLESGFL